MAQATRVTTGAILAKPRFRFIDLKMKKLHVTTLILVHRFMSF